MTEPENKAIRKRRLLFALTVVFAVLDKDKQPTQHGQQTINVMLSLKEDQVIQLKDIGRVQVNAQKRVFEAMPAVDVQPIDVVILGMSDLGLSTDEEFGVPSDVEAEPQPVLEPATEVANAVH